MEVKSDIDILHHDWWSGAEDTVDKCVELGYGDELVQLVEEQFAGDIPDETDVNDFLRFDDDYIFESLGIDEDAEDDEDEEEDD